MIWLRVSYFTSLLIGQRPGLVNWTFGRLILQDKTNVAERLQLGFASRLGGRPAEMGCHDDAG